MLPQLSTSLQITPVGAEVAKCDVCPGLSHGWVQFSKAVQTQVLLQLLKGRCPVAWVGKGRVLLPTETASCPGLSGALVMPRKGDLQMLSH